VEGTGALDGGKGNADQIGSASSFHLPHELLQAFEENVQISEISFVEILVGGGER
jgi:hypothetical protein